MRKLWTRGANFTHVPSTPGRILLVVVLGMVECLLLAFAAEIRRLVRIVVDKKLAVSQGPYIGFRSFHPEACNLRHLLHFSWPEWGRISRHVIFHLHGGLRNAEFETN
jgi:hypothetical protein